MKERGFSLIEALISLGLSLLILLAAFEFFGITRSLFLKLKETHEQNQAIQAALVKLRIDLLHAGYGLETPLRAGVVEGIEAAGASLIILSRDEVYVLSADASPGESRVTLETVTGLSPGRLICLAEEEKAEVHSIAALEGKTILLNEPLEASYMSAIAQLLLIEEVSYFLDERSSVLRRKVNASPAQPLLDDAGIFVPAYQRESNLARVILAGKANQERTYELFVFPKNLGLVLR
jgi:type II secretory pathway pseudopilin PulG